MEYLLAAEGQNPLAFEFAPAVTSVVVFLVFFFMLRALVWPKILRGLDDREQKILSEIASAEAAREKAQSAQEEYEKSLAEARQEAADMIGRAKADAKAAGEELRSRNEAQLSDMKNAATRDINTAKQAAISELHAEAANLASAIATKILQREVSVEDQQRLVEESLRELGRMNGS